MRTCAILQFVAILAASVLACLTAHAVTVKGRVVDVETGKPVAGVHLAVVTKSKEEQGVYEVVPQKTSRGPLTCVTRRNGSFKFQNVDPKSAAIISVDSKWALAESMRVLPKPNGSTIKLGEVRAGEGAQIFGTVFNRDYTQPMAGVVVQARWVDHNSKDIKEAHVLQTVTAEDGTFRITSIPEGEYEIGAAPDGRARQLSSVFTQSDRALHWSAHSGLYGVGEPLKWKQELGPLEFTVELDEQPNAPAEERTATP